MTGLRERNKALRRRAILESTLSFLRERDFDEVTVEEIAERAAVSPHTVYNLVGTRDDVIHALLRRLVGTLTTLAPPAETDPDDPARPVRDLVDHAVDALVAEAGAYRQVVRLGLAITDWPVASSPPQLIARTTQCLAHHDALLPGVSARAVAEHLYLGFVGHALRWANGRASDQRFRSGVRRHTAIVLAGTTRGPVHADALIRATGGTR